MLGGIGNYSPHVQAGESSRTAQLRAEFSQNVHPETGSSSISNPDSYLTALSDASSAIEKKLFSPDGKWRISCDSDQMLWMGPAGEGGALWEIGKTVDNGRIVFSSDSKWLAWQAEDGKIAYRSVVTSMEGSDIRFVQRGDKKFTFSADSQHLFILPKQYEYTQEQRRTLCEVQKRLPRFQSMGDTYLSYMRMLRTAVHTAAAVSVASAAVPLVFAAGPVVLSTALVTKFGMGAATIAVDLYTKRAFNKGFDEILQRQNRLIEENSNRLEIELLSLETNAATSKIKINIESSKVSCIALSGNQKYLFAVEEGKAIRKWDIQTGASEGIAIISDTPITNILPFSSGKWLALANFDKNNANQIQIYSTGEHPEIISQFKIDSKKIVDFDFSRDERWFAVLEGGDQLILFSNELGIHKKIKNIPPGTIHSIYWPENKNILITTGEDNKLNAWEIAIINGISFELRRIVDKNLSQRIIEQSRRDAYLNYVPIEPSLGGSASSSK